MSSSPHETVVLGIGTIRIDGGTQARVAINEEAVADYAAADAGGTHLGHGVAFFDGTDYWLGDGFHRLLARQRNKRDTFTCEVWRGTRRDAILFAVGANSEHGLKRSNADKRKAVGMLLADPEWAKWSDAEISRAAKVSRDLVRELRPGHHAEPQDTPASIPHAGSEPDAGRMVSRGGTMYTMQTDNIGKSDADDAVTDEPPDDSYDGGEFTVTDGPDVPSETPTDDVEDTPAARIAEYADLTKDVFGVPMPPGTRAEEAMRAGNAFRVLAKRLVDGAGQLRQDAALMAGEQEEVDAGYEANAMDETAERLRELAPKAACPHCNGHVGQDCKTCGGRGFVTGQQYGSLTEPERKHCERYKRKAG